MFIVNKKHTKLESLWRQAWLALLHLFFTKQEAIDEDEHLRKDLMNERNLNQFVSICKLKKILAWIRWKNWKKSKTYNLNKLTKISLKMRFSFITRFDSYKIVFI